MTVQFPDSIIHAPVDIGSSTSNSHLIKGQLWPLVEKTIAQGGHIYRPQGTFNSLIGKVVVSTDTAQDAEILKYPRYGEKIKGGRGWDTFARICFGWNNLIMADESGHARMVKIFGPLFHSRTVRERYFDTLRTVTESTLARWSAEKEGVPLLAASLEHACRSVTTCFLGKEAAESAAIVDAVQNLLVIFWENAQLKPLAVIKQLSRTIFGGCCHDWDGYFHSHEVLENAIEEALKRSHDENSFMGVLVKTFGWQEIVDNMKMLYFAGTETTGSLITTIIGNLAANVDCQERLKSELHLARIHSINDLTFEKIQQLPYLHAVLHESLRLAPPLPAQVRKVYAEGSSATYFIDHYHRLRDVRLVGKEPDRFHPERFLENPDLKTEVMKTFGGGLTPCIGRHFALAETLLVVAAAVLHGKIELTRGNPSEVILEAGAHLSPQLKIRLHAKKD